MSRIQPLAAIVILAVAVVACSKKNPAEPSTVTGAGVTVTGTVMAPVPSGLQVSVGGTSTTAQVDGSGQFTLTNVPAGTVDLRFAGSGVSASLVLTNLLAHQTVTLVLTVSGTSAAVESSRRVRGSDEEVEGRIESVSPPNSFVVAGRTISTGGSTSFTASGQTASFNALVVGQRILVKGQGGGGALIATQIDILSPVSVSGLTVIGVITNVTGTRSSFRFVINGTVIQGDDNSLFDPGSHAGELGNGLQIQVTGTQQTGFVYATRIVFVSQQISLTGTITSRTGTAPQIVFVVAGRSVAVNELTDVRRKGNSQDAKAVATGQTVDVIGRPRADGTVVAGMVDIRADAPGGGFWMEGTISTMSGTCPDLLMTAGGYGIETDVQTVFSSPCDQLAIGDKVEVIGIVRADLSVMVTNIKKN